MDWRPRERQSRTHVGSTMLGGSEFSAVKTEVLDREEYSSLFRTSSKPPLSLPSPPSAATTSLQDVLSSQPPIQIASTETPPPVIREQKPNVKKMKKAFLPHRQAPLPPGVVAKTVLVPANIHVGVGAGAGGEEEGRVTMMKIAAVGKKENGSERVSQVKKGESLAREPAVGKAPVEVVLAKESESEGNGALIVKDFADESSLKMEVLGDGGLTLETNPTIISSASTPLPPPPSSRHETPSSIRPTSQPPPATPPSNTRKVSYASTPSQPVLSKLSTPPSTPRSNSTRPSLSHTHSSGTVSCSTTRNLPASQLFKPGADPLILPHLDRYLDSLPEPVFSEVGTVLSEQELEGWRKWVGGEKKSWWKFGEEKRKAGKKDGEKDVEKQALAGGVGEGELEGLGEKRGHSAPSGTTSSTTTSNSTRHLIFPPMHLIPPSVTVTDLKLNRHKSRPLITMAGLISSITDGVIAAEGSSYGIALQTIESFRDIIQLSFPLLPATVLHYRYTSVRDVKMMLTLIMSGSASSVFQKGWYKSLFIKLPAVVSLDFVSAFGKAVIWLWVFTLITLLSVYELWRFTGGRERTKKIDRGEGLDRDFAGGKKGGATTGGFRNSRGYKMTVTFIATSLYLPLSKISIGALAWTSDFWPVPNPYADGNGNPTFVPLGDPATFYAPDQFCWKTTMLRPRGVKNFNWAWIIVPVAFSTVIWLTFFLPWRVYRVIKEEVPQVDKFTELGEQRKNVTAEYERLLDDDPSPFSFLYHEYRRPWAYFKAIYMLVKLLNILLVVLLTKNNCLFRSHTSSNLAIIRESSLLAFMALFLFANTLSKPFINYIQNNSDRVSRISFVLIALIGLLVALNVPGNAALGGGVLIVVQIIAYLFNAYFSLIGTAFAQRVVQRLENRLDFSIDIFSPHLDGAKHIARRVWQETFTAILLTGPEYKMNNKTQLVFTRADDERVAPQLLGFSGTQAERHIENLKILRSIGLEAYYNEVAKSDTWKGESLSGPQAEVLRYFTGPDIYWKPHNLPPVPLVQSYFGRLDVTPFPFACTFRYDEDPASPLIIIADKDLELLISQNNSDAVLQKCRVRQALRALDGLEVYAPYSETRLIGLSKGIEIQLHMDYTVATLSINRNSSVRWQGYNYSSGFNVTFTYQDGQGVDSAGQIRHEQHLTLDGSAFGITSDFILNHNLSKLFRQNQDAIRRRVPLIEGLLSSHRDFFRRLHDSKAHTLSYCFLLDVAGEDSLSKKELEILLRNQERDPRVQNMPATHRASITYLEERMKVVNRSLANQWWFLFFDDLWRRNNGTVTALGSHPEAFSPFYRSSIAFRPMARPQLEAFLRDMGVWKSDKSSGYFHSGFLNRIYFYLDEILFPHTNLAIPVHLGPSRDPVDFKSLKSAVASRGRPDGYTFSVISPIEERSSWISQRTRRTGEGTDHDDWNVRARMAFPFEEMYDPPQPSFSKGQRLFWLKDLFVVRLGGSMKTWLGLRPQFHDNRPKEGEGVTIDLRKGKEGWEVPRCARQRSVEATVARAATSP
ncbi:hypothetical protein T439DRAFT_308870 [Meredithblackwellia eburnea MCA 4105]